MSSTDKKERKARTPLDKALATLGALSADELRELRAEIGILLELWEAEQAPVKEAITLGKSKPEPAGTQMSLEDAPKKGYIEIKTFKGKKGAYKYRRWAEYDEQGNRTLRSRYLGKARDEDS